MTVISRQKGCGGCGEKRARPLFLAYDKRLKPPLPPRPAPPLNKPSSSTTTTTTAPPTAKSPTPPLKSGCHAGPEPLGRNSEKSVP